MTAALRLVPDLDEPDAAEGWPTHTDPHTEDHEQHLIGALMYLSADDAQDVLDRVPDTAICDPTGRWAYELIRHLVREGQDVDPIAVLGAGHRHLTTGPQVPGRPQPRTSITSWPSTWSTHAPTRRTQPTWLPVCTPSSRTLPAEHSTAAGAGCRNSPPAAPVEISSPGNSQPSEQNSTTCWALPTPQNDANHDPSHRIPGHYHRTRPPGRHQRIRPRPRRRSIRARRPLLDRHPAHQGATPRRTPQPLTSNGLTMTICTIIAAAVLASTTLLATPSAAHALLPSISPGDQIDYISDHKPRHSAPWATSTPGPMSTCTA